MVRNCAPLVIAGPGLAFDLASQACHDGHVSGESECHLGLNMDSDHHVSGEGHCPVKGEVIVKQCFFFSSSFPSINFPSEYVVWSSASGRKLANSMYLPILIAWTRCPGMGGYPEVGSTIGDSSLGVTCGAAVWAAALESVLPG